MKEQLNIRHAALKSTTWARGVRPSPPLAQVRRAARKKISLPCPPQSSLMQQLGACSVEGITEAHVDEAAKATEGFSGRSLAKMIASIQTAVYGTSQATLTPAVFQRVVARKVRLSSLTHLTCLEILRMPLPASARNSKPPFAPSMLQTGTLAAMHCALLWRLMARLLFARVLASDRCAPVGHLFCALLSRRRGLTCGMQL